MPPGDGEYHDQHFKTGLKAPNREQLPLRTSSDYPIPRRLSWPAGCKSRLTSGCHQPINK
ncbi:hypothetical protein K456DRAFT_45890 [Colletotrichum gloeosporioides 23]|nr:hypothetical protein K456DRAFT_54491 [Colletotrichum gloeosporioides 23]KAH9240713.1 hypothetical protein K456DRAFT_45890 [Colletotrichum gloeosporioides 23]